MQLLVLLQLLRHFIDVYYKLVQFVHIDIIGAVPVYLALGARLKIAVCDRGDRV